MKTDKQIHLLQKEVGEQLYKETLSYDRIVIDRQIFQEITKKMQKLPDNPIWNWLPFLKKGAFIAKDKNYTDYIIFTMMESDGLSYTIKAASFQGKFREGNTPYYWNYTCVFHVYTEVNEGEQSLEIAIGDFSDAKTEILKKQKQFQYQERYVDQLLTTGLQDRLLNFLTFLKTMSYINYISEYPELKVIEKDPEKKVEKKSKRTDDKPSGNPASKAAANSSNSVRNIMLNGIRIITSDTKAASGLRSRKPHKFTGSWNVRGHYRHYHSGKVIYIQPYEKGTGRKRNSKVYHLEK